MMRTLFLLSASILAACSAQAHTTDTNPPSEVQDIYNIAIEASPERIRDDIQTLVDFGTRHTLSETKSETRGIGAARRWIFAEFEKISKECGGCLEVIYVSDTISGERRIPDPTDVVSVLAIQKGTTDPNRYVMMSGDIDSRVTDPLDGTSDSPGANDNASGMAGTIEAARILSKRKYAGSIIYAGLSGEEQGLFGGEIVAAHALKQGWEIKGVLNNDMISNISGIDGVIDNSSARVFSEGTRANETEAEARTRRFTGGEVDSPSRNLARYIKAQADQYMTNLNVMLTALSTKSAFPVSALWKFTNIMIGSIRICGRKTVLFMATQWMAWTLTMLLSSPPLIWLQWRAWQVRRPSLLMSKPQALCSPQPSSLGRHQTMPVTSQVIASIGA